LKGTLWSPKIQLTSFTLPTKASSMPNQLFGPPSHLLTLLDSLTYFVKEIKSRGFLLFEQWVIMLVL